MSKLFLEYDSKKGTIKFKEGKGEEAEKISSKRIKKLWKSMTKNSMPKIKGFYFREKEYEQLWKFCKELQSKEMTKAEIEEWGRPLQKDESAGYVTYIPKEDFYLIVIRLEKEGVRRTRKDLEGSLEHELRHILKDEVGRVLDV